MGTVLRSAIILIAAGVGAIGSAAYHQFPWIASREKIVQQKSCGELARATAAIDTSAFIEHFSSGYLVIDARSAAEFEKGRLDAPLIINLPPDRVEEKVVDLLGQESEPIAIYCTSLTCDLGEEVYCSLERLGFINLKLYLPGWDDGIVKEGLPTTAGAGADFGTPTGAADPASEGGG